VFEKGEFIQSSNIRSHRYTPVAKQEDELNTRRLLLWIGLMFVFMRAWRHYYGRKSISGLNNYASFLILRLFNSFYGAVNISRRIWKSDDDSDNDDQDEDDTC